MTYKFIPVRPVTRKFRRVKKSGIFAEKKLKYEREGPIVVS